MEGNVLVAHDQNMLDFDVSPTKQKAVKSRRVLEWVNQSFNNGSQSVVKASPKRKFFQTFTEEIHENELNNDNPKDKIRCVQSPQAADINRFYPRKEKENTSYGISQPITFPSTPESKSSNTTGSACFSPSKLDGILVLKQSKKEVTNLSFSDSESLQSTPKKAENPINGCIKSQIHVLPYGLDSPVSETTTPTNKSSEKRFFKLGHRVANKTPLQLFKEAIAQSNKKLNRSGVRTPTNKPVKSLEDACSNTTGSPSSSACENTSNQSTETPPPTQGTPQTMNKSSEDIDKTDTTLVCESPNLTQKKLLPLFKKGVQSRENDGKEQMVIDAGQKNLDEATQCSVCRMIYSKGDPNDEALHKQFHSQLISALKFTGWKKENVVLHGCDYRIIYVDVNDPPYCQKKIQLLKVILDQELGFVPEASLLHSNRKIYLYIGEDKIIRGVCLVESISTANRLMGNRVSVQSTPAYIGVNRLWVYAKYRRSGVATKLLDTIRSTHEMGLCVPRNEVAFSDPTSHGKSFAEKYTGTQHFLVYRP